jgi:hypothetical protein
MNIKINTSSTWAWFIAILLLALKREELIEKNFHVTLDWTIITYKLVAASAAALSAASLAAALASAAAWALAAFWSALLFLN